MCTPYQVPSTCVQMYSNEKQAFDLIITTSSRPLESQSNKTFVKYLVRASGPERQLYFGPFLDAISHLASVSTYSVQGFQGWFLMYASRYCIRASIRRFSSQGEQDLQLARDWLKALNTKTIPRNICEISFSRSSGPGGQNVNKSVSPPPPTIMLQC